MGSERERQTDREQDKDIKREKLLTKEYMERVIGTLRKQDKAK